MISQLIITFILLLGFIGVIFLSEFLHKKFSVHSEYTRKLAHVVASLSSLVFLAFIDSHWYILFLGVFFFLLLFLGRKFMLFKSIDAVKRNTAGSYLLPVAIYLLFMVYDIWGNSIYYVLPILILAISDTLAGVIGAKYGDQTKGIKFFNFRLKKSYVGSGAFFISSLFISLIVFYAYGFSVNQIIIWSLLIAVLTTFTELLSLNGYDNLSIPVVMVLILWLLL